MKNEFVPYEITLELKKLGFNEPCLARYFIMDSNGNPRGGEFKIGYVSQQYDNTCSAPLYQQAFRWFREKHNINSIPIKPHWEKEHKRFIYRYSFFELNEYRIDEFEQWDSTDWWLTTKEAELACLRKLIEIVKEKL